MWDEKGEGVKRWQREKCFLPVVFRQFRAWPTRASDERCCIRLMQVDERLNQTQKGVNEKAFLCQSYSVNIGSTLDPGARNEILHVSILNGTDLLDDV